MHAYISNAGARSDFGALFGVTGTEPVHAKDKVKVGFIGSLTGGTSANGLGGRNSADLAVRLRNADPKAKYEYEMVALDDECKPNVGVQQATKLAADKEIIAAADALLLGRRHRHGRRLPQVRSAGDRVGRRAARHHLSQQVRRECTASTAP